MTTWIRDLRFVLRQLALHRGFAAAAILTLALGFAALGSIFSVLNAVLLTALPYPDPTRLLVLDGVLSRDGGEPQEVPASYLDFIDWRRHNRTFQRMVAYAGPRSFNLQTAAGNQEIRHVSGEMVSAGYFELLGVQPAAGRSFNDDDLASEHRAVMLGHGLWQRGFDGDPALVGRSVTLNEESYEVLGILPRGFAGLTDKAELWLPVTTARQLLAPHYMTQRRFRWISVLARLAPGATLQQARAEMETLTANLAAVYPDTNAGAGVRLDSLTEAWFGPLRGVLRGLLSGAGFVMLIVCANVTNLQLARAWSRQQEFAVRMALGARRRQVLRLLLAENLVLALAGCVAGAVLAHASTGFLVARSAVDLQSFLSFGVDLRVAGFLLFVALAAAFGIGLSPAWLASRAAPAPLLRAQGRGATSRRSSLVQNLSVVVQVALALVLTLGAAATARSFQDLLDTDLGIEPEELLTLRVDLKSQRYAGLDAKRQLARRFLDEVGPLSGVASLALEGPGIPTDDWFGSYFVLEDDAADAEPWIFLYHHVSPGYFTALGTPLLAGRDFSFDDTPSGPLAVVVSETLAARAWPSGDAVGRRLRFARQSAEEPGMTVIGVVGDVRHRGLGGGDPGYPDLYFSILQLPPSSPPTFNFLVRARQEPVTRLVPALRQKIRDVAPELPVYDVATLADRLGGQTAGRRFLVFLTGFLALLALVLAAVGVYGVVSYGVTQRTRELGLRLALGARPGDILRLVAGHSIRLALAGVALGLVASFILSRLLAGRFYDLDVSDPGLWVLAALLLSAVALAAGYLPARRAARMTARKALDAS